MRIIPLEDTKNAYTRIRGMNAYEGLDLDPEKTAPFKVRWNPNCQGPEIVIRDTIMAVVDLGDRGPRLHINETYPEDMDFALLRALRNAVSFAEQVSRIKKHETPKMKLFGSVITDSFQVADLSPTQFLKAWAVLEAENHRFSIITQNTLDREVMHLSLPHGSTSANLKFEVAGDRIICHPRSSKLSADTLISLLKRGIETWEVRMVPEELVDLMQRVSDKISGLDVYSMKQAHRTAGLKGKLRSDSLSFGDLTRDADRTVRFRGIAIGHSSDEHVTLYSAFETLGLQPNLVEDAMRGMAWLDIISSMGKSPEDFKKIDPDALRDQIREINYGYDL